MWFQEWQKFVRLMGTQICTHLSVDLILALDAGGHSMVRGWCELFTRPTDRDSNTFQYFQMSLGYIVGHVIRYLKYHWRSTNMIDHQATITKTLYQVCHHNLSFQIFHLCCLFSFFLVYFSQSNQQLPGDLIVIVWGIRNRKYNDDDE